MKCKHFLPKFHPELNPIERVWGKAKQYARNNCNTFEGLKRKISPALESVSLELEAVVESVSVGIGGCGSELTRGWVLSSSTPRRSRVLSPSCGILWLNQPPCQYGLTTRLAVTLGYVTS